MIVIVLNFIQLLLYRNEEVYDAVSYTHLYWGITYSSDLQVKSLRYVSLTIFVSVLFCIALHNLNTSDLKSTVITLSLIHIFYHLHQLLLLETKSGITLYCVSDDILQSHPCVAYWYPCLLYTSNLTVKQKPDTNTT